MGLKRGLLITFEGIEGCGKSTQINKLYNFFKKKKIKCIKTREPGGTKLSEKIRKIIIEDLKNNEDNFTELLLLFASRSNHMLKISNYLKKNYVIICDRYIDSTLVYQHYEQGQSLKLINLLQKKIEKKTKPYITFLLDIPVALSKKRLLNRKKIDRFDKYSKNKLNKLRNNFLKLSKKFKRIEKIDASNDINTVHKDIIKYLLKKNVI